MLPALALIAAAVSRAVYPLVVERRRRQARPLGPAGIIAGAEAIDLPLERATAVLLIHGAGDTPQALSGLARYLHSRGFAVRVPLLAGHGRDLSALRNASAKEWARQIRREFDQLCETNQHVAVVGLSMGGALAIALAAERPDVEALVLLAPYVEMPPYVRRLAVTSPAWGWLFPYFSTRGAASIRDPDAASKALGHGILTPAVLRALVEVVNTAYGALPSVQAPTLIIQSREDNRIAPEIAERGFARLGAQVKRFIWTTGAGHVISVDFGRERVFELTAQWIERYQNPARKADRRPRISSS
jgi:carboxylesterase